jgi:hypothetical protein
MDRREYVFSNCVKNPNMFGILIEYVRTGDRGEDLMLMIWTLIWF